MAVYLAVAWGAERDAVLQAVVGRVAVDVMSDHRAVKGR
jgi:hypothetical protein